jgi:hypothetical protein
MPSPAGQKRMSWSTAAKGFLRLIDGAYDVVLYHYSFFANVQASSRQTPKQLDPISFSQANQLPHPKFCQGFVERSAKACNKASPEPASWLARNVLTGLRLVWVFLFSGFVLGMLTLA